MKTMQRTLAALSLVVLGSLLPSCGEPENPTAEQRRPITVRIHTVAVTDLPQYFEAPGTIRAAVSTVVSSRVTGRIDTFLVQEGDRVAKGQLIAEIDSRDASTRLRRAQGGLTEATEAQQELARGIRAAEAGVKLAVSNRDLAASTLTRYTVLRDRKSVSPQEFDEVEGRLKGADAAVEQATESLAAIQAKYPQILARIEQAMADVEAAEAGLSDHKITSPLSGTITEKKAEPGMMAGPGMPLVAIEDESRYELEVAVEEGRIAAIRVGQEAALQINALNQTVQGRVVRILPLGDPTSRTYSVRLQLQNTAKPNTLRSGFFGRARFEAGNKTALVIPQSAMVERAGLSGVYVVSTGTAVFRIVKSGETYGEEVEILSGLKPEERIVLTSSEPLSDGAQVVEGSP